MRPLFFHFWGGAPVRWCPSKFEQQDPHHPTKNDFVFDGAVSPTCYTTQGRQRLHNFKKFEKFWGSGTKPCRGSTSRLPALWARYFNSRHQVIWHLHVGAHRLPALWAHLHVGAILLDDGNWNLFHPTLYSVLFLRFFWDRSILVRLMCEGAILLFGLIPRSWWSSNGLNRGFILIIQGVSDTQPRIFFFFANLLGKC